jgi:hypothetical protein
LHKESTTISQNHAVVVLEDLQIRNMSKAAKGNVDHVAAMNILAVRLDRSSLWRKGVSLSVKQEPVGNREKLPLLVN